jgi:ABC-type sulfate/molybdate transport systems ATPase subunit
MNRIKESDWSIKLNHISIQLQQRQVLTDIDLQITCSDFILLTGHNGSGKSTLLRIIAGLLKPDKAKISYSDIIRNWSQAKKFLRQHICYLHQHPYLFDGTVFDNIAYGLRQKGLRQKGLRQKKICSKEIHSKVEQALQAISLEHLVNRDSRELSGGEKQRVAIARSWIISPRVILLDEPFANMDKESRIQCYKLINQLKNDNIGVIVTSHEPLKGELEFNQHIHLYHGKKIKGVRVD